MKNFMDRSFTRIIFAAFFALIATELSAATRYVDSSATGSNNGSSWANAWTTLSAVSASPGDIVYISGGPSGSTRTYAVPSVGYWNLPSGTSSAWITYQIAQDSAHNGTAIFTAGLYQLLSGPSYFTFSGDAGDGAMHFRLSGFSNKDVISNINHFHFEYVDGSGGVGAIGSIGNGSENNVEINNCYFNVVDLGADHGIYAAFAGSSPSDNKIHHNTILIPHIGPGTGADGIQGAGSGYSIYNNTIRGYTAAYTGGQHQDGYQSTGGSSIRIYNNAFIDCSNYAIYGDAYFAGFSDFYVYNNIIAYEDSALLAGTPGGIIFGVDGGYVGPSPCTFTNVVLANNVICDYQNNGGVALSNITSRSSSFVNCKIENNLLVNNAGGIRNEGNSTTTIAKNVEITSTAAPSMITKYVKFGGRSNDYTPLPSANSLIGTGANLSSYFSTDISGLLRIASGNWDIGIANSGGTSTVTAQAPSNAKISIVTQ